jgi:hypothetical protein
MDIRPCNIRMRMVGGTWLAVLKGLGGFRTPDDGMSVSKSKPIIPLK